MRTEVQYAHDEISGHLDEIATIFKPGVKLTLLARRPAHPDGSQDMLVTNDALDEVIKALEIRKAEAKR